MSRYHSPPFQTLSFLHLVLFTLFQLSLLSPLLSQSPLSWTSPYDPCYHLDGRPRHCLSEFINTAYGVPVIMEDLQQGPKTNISTLTDLHNPHNLTCWTAAEGLSSGDWTFTVPLERRFEITYISLQFCQQVEAVESYSISILKSMDFGRSWRPLQFYSSDCMGTFGLPDQSIALTKHQETEPLCTDPRPLQKHRGSVVLAFSTLDGRPSSPDFDYSPGLQDWVTATDIKIVFHLSMDKIKKQEEKLNEVGRALRGRAGGERGNTIIRFGEKKTGAKTSEIWGSSQEKNKEQKQSGQNVTRKEMGSQGKEGRGRGRSHNKESWKPCQDGTCDWSVNTEQQGSKGRELRRRRNNGRREKSHSKSRKKATHQLTPSALYTPSKAPLSLSDLQVGGRCKCNGHASRCRRDNQGRAVCQCEHHTSGPDCDVCEQFFYDRPWQRATPSQPHPCVPCECNGHSTKCRFSMAVYQQSGRVSGGICLKCRHHTTGRHCQFCQNGYTRDHSKPLSHRKACQSCQCHPMGAVGHWCNQSTGQCLCREGVIGQRCNRCAPGYKQGQSPHRPCIRIQEVAPPTPVYQPQYSIGEECLSYCPPSQAKVRMNLETYCLKDYVLKMQVKGKERSGPWWQFSVLVQSVFHMGSSHVKRGLQALWVPDRDLSCGCPALQVGRTFLLIGAVESGRSWVPEEQRLVADRTTMALQWREHWSPKLRGFRGQDIKGKCLQRNNTAQKHSHSDSYEEYTPPHLEKLQSEPHAPHKHTHSTHNHHPSTAQHRGLDLGHTHKRGDTQDLHRKGIHAERHHGLVKDRKAENGSLGGRIYPSASPQDTQNLLQNTQDPSTSHANEHEQYYQTVCPTWSPGSPV
ncbi:netrin-1 [Myxocyprinus asiaticus]|uniref:netrin-1 n=1 Tax=Myxocyprinus asiaticus TaxID=70543 RepID=UPI0022220EA8|nr:netrin-1 [Myxocyprinus asiaticus]XP_051580083.1 netrin-1 [Myxocyprinus asiaticus]XP_051580090.1 netrin-1 [Myxocyprinus asiaticus]